MMYSELFQYLLQHKELPVPGIGTFLLERQPAMVDFPNKQIIAPSYAVAMQHGGHLPGKSFFNWLAQSLHISDREAIFRFNDFAFELKKQLVAGDIITWNSVGTLSKGLGGEVKFAPLEAIMPEKPVPAEKVIRQHAAHMVRVGEDQKTSDEMVEMLNQPEEKKSFWWAYALALGLLAIMFLGWYFSEHGVETASAANGSKAAVQEMPAATYRVLP